MIRRLYRIYRPHLGWLLLGTPLALVTLLANVGLLAISGWFITAMAGAGLAGTSMNYFGPAAIIRGLAMIRTAGRYGERVVTHEATFRLIADLRVWFYRRIEPLAPAGLAAWRSGELLNRLQRDIDRLDAVYLRIALPLLVAAIGILLFTLFMALYDPFMALLNLGFLLFVGVALPLWINRLSRDPGRHQVQLESELRTCAVDTIQGMADLTAYGADGAHARRFRETADQWLAAQDRLQSTQSLGDAAQGLLAQLAVWGVLLLGIGLLQAGLLDGPQLAMLALFTLASFEAIAPLPAALGVVAETAEAARRLFTVADTPPVIEEPARPRTPPKHGGIRFEQVCLQYDPNGQPALQDLDFSLPEGSLTLLRGASGSGKSSIASLLLRFRDPDAGRILFAGNDLKTFASEQWRERVALVAQDTQLIAGTIRDNLLLARPDAQEDELLAACAQAHIDDFIRTLPEGLDTWVGETGARFSGGQARRIAIARALLKNAPLLILDEPTEGLDRRTEQLVIDSLMPLIEGRTVLLISHRALGLTHIQQTLTLQHGRIVSQTQPFQH